DSTFQTAEQAELRILAGRICPRDALCVSLENQWGAGKAGCRASADLPTFAGPAGYTWRTSESQRYPSNARASLARLDPSPKIAPLAGDACLQPLHARAACQGASLHP